MRGLVLGITVLGCSVTPALAEDVRAYPETEAETAPAVLEDAAFAVRTPDGEMIFSADEYQFFYRNMILQFMESAGEYQSYLALDLSLPLSEQGCTISTQYASWEEYFIHETDAMLRRIGAMYLEAISEEEEEADADPSSLPGESVEAYGPLVTEDTVRRAMQILSTATGYAAEAMASWTFTDAELEQYYAEHLEEFRSVTYLLAFVSGSGYKESADTCLGLLQEAESEQAFQDLTEELTGAPVSRVEGIRLEEMGNPEAEDVRWLLSDERAAGDIYTGQSGEDYFVLYFLSADDQGYPDDPDGAWRETAGDALRESRYQTWMDELADTSETEDMEGKQEAVLF